MAGTTLKNLGLDHGTIEDDLINVQGGFIDLARASKQTEAISTLLDQTNNWIAARDSGRRMSRFKFRLRRQPRHRPIQRRRIRTPPPLGPSARSGPPKRVEASAQAQAAPLKQASSEWLPVIIVAVPVGLMVAAVHLLDLALYRRAQGRVAGRIKEIKSKAVDVMDRLDGLKERLKLMPTLDRIQAADDRRDAGALYRRQRPAGQALGWVASCHGRARKGAEAGGAIGLAAYRKRRWPRPRS